VPDHEAAADPPSNPVAIPESTIDMPELAVSIELDEDSVTAGSNLHGVAPPQQSRVGQGRVRDRRHARRDTP